MIAYPGQASPGYNIIDYDHKAAAPTVHRSIHDVPYSHSLTPLNLIFEKQVVLDEIPIPTPAPVAPAGAYAGIPQEIPGLIEVEFFDYGGEGVGYSDTDAGNIGGVRTAAIGHSEFFFGRRGRRRRRCRWIIPELYSGQNPTNRGSGQEIFNDLPLSLWNWVLPTI